MTSSPMWPTETRELMAAVGGQPLQDLIGRTDLAGNSAGARQQAAEPEPGAFAVAAKDCRPEQPQYCESPTQRAL